MGFSGESNLDKILFGDSDMPFVLLKVEDAERNNDRVYLTVHNHLKEKELQIALPIQYVSYENIDIVDLLSAVNNYNYNNQNKETKKHRYEVYLGLGRKGINGAIPQNDNRWILQDPRSFNIVVSSGGLKNVYNAFRNLWKGRATVLRPTSELAPYRNSLWGQGDYIIVYQNIQQVEEVLNLTNLAKYISKTNNLDPSSLYVGTIAVVKESGVYKKSYEGKEFLVVRVKNYYDTDIIFRTEKYIPLFSDL